MMSLSASSVGELYSDKPDSEWPRMAQRDDTSSSPTARRRPPRNYRSRKRSESPGRSYSESSRTRSRSPLSPPRIRSRWDSSSSSSSSQTSSPSSYKGSSVSRSCSSSSYEERSHSRALPSNHKKHSYSQSSPSHSSSSSDSGSRLLDRGGEPEMGEADVEEGEYEDDMEDLPRFKMEYKCDVCQVYAPTFTSLQDHFAGERHRKALMKTGLGESLQGAQEVKDPRLKGKILRCLLCNVILAEAEATHHLNSRGHLSALEKEPERMRDVDPDQWFVKATKVSSNGSQARRRDYMCEVCQVSSPTYAAHLTHTRGKRHLRAVKLSQRSKIETTTSQSPNQQLLWCKICNITCTCQESLDMHLRGKRHLKTLKHMHINLDRGGGISSTNPNAAGAVKNPARIRCTLCDVVLSNTTETQAHLATTEHYLALREKSAGTDNWTKTMFEPA